MAIERDLILTVNNNTATLNEPVYIYRGDRGIYLNIRIQKFRFLFNRKTLEDMVDSTIVGARAIVTSPKHDEAHKKGVVAGDGDGNNKDVKTGKCFEVPLMLIHENKITIPIDATWVDEIEEEGEHTVQIQLYGNKFKYTDKDGNLKEDYERITIPPVVFHVEPLNCDYEEEFDDSEFPTVVGPSGNDEPYGFDIDDDKEYHPFGFEEFMIMPYSALNEMEDALVYITTEMRDDISEEAVNRHTEDKRLDKKIDSSVSTLQTQINDTKADLEENIADVQAIIDSNINERINALDGKITNQIEADIEKTEKAIEKEVKDRASAVKNLSDEHDADVYALEVKIANNKKEVEGRIKNIERNMGIALNYKGELNRVGDLPENPAKGDCYAIGQEIYAWNGSLWNSLDIRGPQGEKGITFIYSGDRPDSYLENVDDILWVVDSEQEEYATVGYVDETVANNKYTHPSTHNANMITGLSNVAKSGAYNDLSGRPSIPTKTSELRNDSNFLVCEDAVKVKFVTEYPANEEPNVLYILIEEQ